MRRICLIFISFFLFTVGGCYSSVDYHLDDSVEKIPLRVLLSTPENLIIDGVPLKLKPNLWRDFAPSSPADGKPLIAGIEIVASKGKNLPDDLDTDAVWVAKSEAVWGAHYSDELFEEDPKRIVKIAREGPKFGPNIKVEVIARLRYKGNTYFLRASGVKIEKTF